MAITRLLSPTSAACTPRVRAGGVGRAALAVLAIASLLAAPAHAAKPKAGRNQPPVVEEPVDVVLSPSLQARLDATQTRAAWAFIDSEIERLHYLRNQSTGGILDPFKKQKEQLKQMLGLKIQVRQMMEKPVSMDVFDILCDDMAAALAENLRTAVGDRTPKGGEKFVLLVGKFGFVFSDSPGARGAAGDRKLGLLLQRVIDRVGANPGIAEKFILVSAPTADGAAVLRAVGGDSAQWVGEDGRNFRDAYVQDYHPDDVYVLLGEMIQESGGPYSELYDTSCRLMHPRSRGQAAIGTPQVRTTMLYHPSRGWITKVQDDALGANPPAK